MKGKFSKHTLINAYAPSGDKQDEFTEYNRYCT